jgi:two-component system, NarL family, response regulator DesR
MTIHVLVVEDHPLMRRALVHAAQSDPGVQVVGEAADGTEALRLARELRPDVLLMDIHLPGIDGITLLEHLRAEHSECRVLVVSASERPALVQSVVEAGARGFLSKRTDAADLARAIREVHDGGVVIEPRLTPALLQPSGTRSVDGDSFDATELAMLRLVSQGLTDQQIANAMFVSRRTVQNYLLKLRRKTGTTRRAALTRWAAENGWT